MDSEEWKLEQREKIIKRLEETKRNEGICFRGWEAEILIEYIKELKERGGKS